MTTNRIAQYLDGVEGGEQLGFDGDLNVVADTNGGVTDMFSVRVAPWHGLGRVLDKPPSIEEAIKLAGLNWDVEQRTVHFDSGNLIKNWYANCRSDTGEVLGMVTDRYQIVQNRESFSFLDKLVGEGELELETAGVLQGGRKIWLLARMNQEYSVLGDKFDPYICFQNSHDGSGAVKVAMTPIRVVCQNMLNMAMQTAKRSWSTKHTGDIAAKLKDAQHTLLLAQNYLDKLEEEADKLAQIEITAKRFAEVLEHLIPTPTGKAATDRALANVKARHDAIHMAMNAPDIERFKGTGWQVMNAISDYVGHTQPLRASEKFVETRFAKVVAGEPTFDDFYKLVLKSA